jgi:hypothetical protein
MKKLCVLLLAVCVAGVGCGKKASEKITEKILEKSMEKDGIKTDVKISKGRTTITTTDKDGAKVDIESSGDQVTIKSQDGTTAFTTGSSAKLPDTFPKDVYVHDGATVATTVTTPEGCQVSLNTKDSAKAVTAAYKAKMAANGWKEDSAFSTDEQTVVAYTKGNRSTTVIVMLADGSTQITLMAMTEKE